MKFVRFRVTYPNILLIEFSDKVIYSNLCQWWFCTEDFVLLSNCDPVIDEAILAELTHPEVHIETSHLLFLGFSNGVQFAIRKCRRRRYNRGYEEIRGAGGARVSER